MKRRNVVMAIAANMLASSTLAYAPSVWDPKHTLVVWYSRRGENYIPGGVEVLTVGHTERLAKHAAEVIGCPDWQIETVKAYPESYRKTTEVAQEEIAANVRPALRGPMPDLSDIGVVVLGHPIWWGRLPPAVTAFLERVDLSNKIVLHFCTHAGSGFGMTKLELLRLAPNARIIDGPAIEGVSAGARVGDIDRWLVEAAGRI